MQPLIKKVTILHSDYTTFNRCVGHDFVAFKITHGWNIPKGESLPFDREWRLYRDEAAKPIKEQGTLFFSSDKCREVKDPFLYWNLLKEGRLQ